jgi:adenylyltransferase/sulfurtransferase
VIGVLPGVLGTLQAAEVIKLVAGLGKIASGRLVHYDALALEFSAFRVVRDADCALCGEQPTIVDLPDDAASGDAVTAEGTGIVGR